MGGNGGSGGEDAVTTEDGFDGVVFQTEVTSPGQLF